ncbi:MAG: OsmC family peroxiredoxin [Chitinophagaceae bacterium]|nr:MAG: OsmC family peroxiredoxin [Chitinophagaceae bacterium]
MQISASIKNNAEQNSVMVTTNGAAKELAIPQKANGQGSAVNGGELLFLALATCFCNDIYREAAKRQLVIKAVDVTVNGEFGSEGEPGFNIRYNVNIDAEATPAEIRDLVLYVDKIAEVHNTLRVGTAVTFVESASF